MSQYNDPGKIEEAMKSVVDGIGLSVYSGESGSVVAVNTGQDDEELTTPGVVCSVVDGSGEEWVRGTGNFETDAIIIVASSAQDCTLSNHRQRAGNVFDAFMQDGIAATLSAAVTDFHVFQVIPRAPSPTRRERISGEDDEFLFITEMRLSLKWCGSTIA